MFLIRSSFSILILFFLFVAFVFPSVLTIFKSFIPLLLGLVMFFMGITLRIKDFKNSLKKPQWFLVATFLQFTVMPITAIFLINTFKIPSDFSLGIIILGCCPGGTASNLIAYLCKGNVALSIISTFCSTMVSVFLTPVLIFFLAKENIEINVFSLIKSSFFIVFIPVILGLSIKTFIQIEKSIQYLPKLSEFLIAFIIGIIFSLNIDYVGDLSLSLFLCIILHNIIGLLTGYLIANLLNIPDKEKKTIAIEVGMQNSGLGMTLSLLHFSKIVAIPSAIFSLWHNISAVGLVYFWKKK